jgi:hypothetical protein
LRRLGVLGERYRRDAKTWRRLRARAAREDSKTVQVTGCSDMTKIRAVLDRQKHALLARMEAIIEQRKKQLSEEEENIQE